MRFFFGKKDRAPRWVDTGALGWTPDEPLDFPPETQAPPTPVNDTVESGWRPQPRVILLAPPADRSFETPVEDAVIGQPVEETRAEPVETIAALPFPVIHIFEPEQEDRLGDWRDVPRIVPLRENFGTRREPAPPKKPIPLDSDAGWSGEWKAEPRAEPAPRAHESTFEFRDPPLAANSDRAPNWLLLRLGAGLAQGVALSLLLAARNQGLWPGSDPVFFTALLLAGLIAPLALLEGLGEVEPRLLLLWTGTLGFVTASLGVWQAARGGLSFMAVATIAMLVLITHVAVRASLRDAKPLPHYRSWFEIGWTLAARLIVWAAMTGFAFLLIGSGKSLLNWLKAHHPGLELQMGPAFLNLPLLALAGAGAFALTAHGRLRNRARAMLLTCATVALPMLLVGSLIALAVHVLVSGLPAMLLLGLAALLVLAFNASYREGPREPWRKYGEFAAGFVILALAVAGIGALHVRVLHEGWTDMRIYAGVAATLLTLYGLAYAGAALISSGGAPWMKPVEFANPVLAVLLLLACLGLSTPLFDPLSVAVKAQVGRLDNAASSNPKSFDFAWLRQSAGRFGQDALAKLILSPKDDVARAAMRASTLSDLPPPTPSEIGANITLHTPGRLPQALLAEDWSKSKVVPCLTRPGLACDAWFLDLDGDGVQEILLVHGDDTRFWASVMKLDQGRWKASADLTSPPCPGMLSRMRERGVLLANPLSQWRDVLVAGMRLTPVSMPTTLPCPR